MITEVIVVMFECVFVISALQGQGLRKRWAGTADSDTTAEMEELQQVWRKDWRSWRRYVC